MYEPYVSAEERIITINIYFDMDPQKGRRILRFDSVEQMTTTLRFLDNYFNAVDIKQDIPSGNVN
jgi:hypothetical protein